jgi:hypothetical protein
MKAITFSTKFPTYHPKAGKPTFFEEQLCSCLLTIDWEFYSEFLQPKAKPKFSKPACYYNKFNHKGQTIRKGYRFNIGERFSPRIWSGRPYWTPQIVFAPEVLITKVWNFKIENRTLFIDGKKVKPATLALLAKNDGFENTKDFLEWLQFPRDFEGQIICWDNRINY